MNSYDKIIDDEDLIIFSPIFIFRRNKVKLFKDNDYNLQIKFHKKLISNNNENDIEILENKIKNFLIVMNSKCKNFKSTVFYKNFRKTWFNLKKLNSKVISGIDGSVKISTFVNILELKRLSASYHELLHLSSLKKTVTIYDPFNEGYTQLLEERYFNEADPSYYLEVEIMKVIELIFGQQELEKLYFSGNFTNLFKMISEYASDDNLINLYNSLKTIYEIEQQREFIKNKELLQHHLNQTFEILLVCYLNKNYLNMDDNIFENIDFFKEKLLSNIGLISPDGNELIFNKIKEEKISEIVEGFKNRKRL